MHRTADLPFAVAVTCAVAAGCATLAAPPPTEATMDLGGGLTMTADGAIRGALPMWPAPGPIDGDTTQAAAQR